MRNISLRVRLIAFLLIGGLLPIVTMSGFIFWFVQNRLQENLGIRLSISAEELRDRIDRELFDGVRDLKSMAEHADVIRAPDAVIGSYLRESSRKKSYFGHDRFVGMALLDEGGRTVFRGGDVSVQTANPQDSAEITGEIRISGMYDVPGMGWRMNVDVPIQSDAGRFGGMIRAVMDLRYLEDLMRREKLSGGLRRDVVLFSADRSIIARKQTGTSRNLNDEFPLFLTMTAAPSTVTQGALPNGESAMAAVQTLVGLAAPLDTLKWKIAVIQPLDDRSEETVNLILQLRRGILLAAVIALIACLAFSAILLRSILNPLGKLSDAAQRVKQGDLTSPINDGGRDELGQLSGVFNEMMGRLSESLRKLTELATVDALTGLANRRVFNERIEQETKRARRYDREMSIAVLDIDHFKRCNDTHGHAAGDAILRGVAGICRHFCRETDFIARFGGEEIVFIFPETSKQNCAAVVERIRAAIESARFDIGPSGTTAAVTVSIGIAVFPADGSNAEDIFAKADAALYEAKRGGRNRVVSA